ncbi:MAG TPA: DNA polymerase domain-containing protein [Firmicutes bacterium]|nr:DNA polymerase domain-containing protein [Bacillota bacterium]
MSTTNTQYLTVNGHQIPVKNLDKPFWPEDGYTKADVMAFYIKVWPYLAPHLKDRPLSLVRYPEGINGQYFYQKNFPAAPPWVETIPIRSKTRVTHYVMANNLETLIWSINLGCIEVHPWLSTQWHLDYPTYVIFDLDPMAPATFQEAVQVAFALKSLTDHLGLALFPKISGATGLHLYLPVKPVYSYRETATFVQRLGEAVIRVLPGLATNERMVSARGGKVYIDHLQNQKGKTIASVYSLRPFAGAPVSMPVTWEELPTIQPDSFNITNAAARLAATGDLFAPLLSLQQELPTELLS